MRGVNGSREPSNFPRGRERSTFWSPAPAPRSVVKLYILSDLHLIRTSRMKILLDCLVEEVDLDLGPEKRLLQNQVINQELLY